MSAASLYPAPAKLNLMLRVTGRRADGYHLLQTVFRFIDFGDTLRIVLRTDAVIRRNTDVAGVPEADDLTLRAARLLQSASGTRLGAEITLEKRLPIGGGLGGGSSDAATTLIVLNRLWNLNWPRARLQALALELGADVPLFVFGESAVGEGVGEKLAPLTLYQAWYLVLIPPVSVATARVFQDPDLIRDSNPIKIPPFSPGAAQNDLEPVVCRHYPEVAQHLAWLRRFGSAHMTGSGACVFAEFAAETEARRLLLRMPETMHGVVARGLDCHPLWHLGV
ncbi:MAG TPA: 4-(cytidine 5'-diphospho)-2-C-methyl-D-erythritol kinase [Burkholderiales bacterium]|jgi:4-diphosphocytidyl-2-C-methyl-D-erythritol kinase|nr:4-(cytidine 5'-diphospho)-2-C-methyl-D-erythritol kinase [Burkholderiales bacterium]